MMRKESISNSDGAAMCVLVVLANTLSVLPGVEGGSAWISCVLAGALALVSSFFITVCCDRFPDEEFFGVLEKCTGKIVGRVICIIFILLSLMSLVVSLTVFSRFVQMTALPRTPQIILPLLISVAAAISVRGSLKSVSSAAQILVWFVLFVFVLFIAFGAGEIYPPLLLTKAEGARGIFLSAGEIFLNRFGAIPALSVIYTKMENKNTRRRCFLSSIALSAFIIAAVSAICVAMLGETSAKTDFYPVYTAMSLFSLGGFVQHTEILACVAMTLCLFFKGCVCLSFINETIGGVSGLREGSGFFLPLALISAYLTQVIYRDLSSLRGLLSWSPGAGAVLLVYLILPVAVCVPMFFKMKKIK